MEKSPLGRKLDTFSFNWFTYIIFALGFLAFVEICVYGTIKPDRQTLIVIALTIVGFSLILLFVLFQKMTRFQVHENGLVVIDKGKRRVWAWDEISRVDGFIHTLKINGIGVQSGESTFFAGEEIAFKVSTSLAYGDLLILYCMSRMAETCIPKAEEDYRAGKTLHLAGMDIELKGIRNSNYFYDWSEIENVTFDYSAHDRPISIKLQTKAGRSFVIGSIFGLDAFILIGLVDVLRGSKNLQNIQRAIFE